MARGKVKVPGNPDSRDYGPLSTLNFSLARAFDGRRHVLLVDPDLDPDPEFLILRSIEGNEPDCDTIESWMTGQPLKKYQKNFKKA